MYEAENHFLRTMGVTSTNAHAAAALLIELPQPIVCYLAFAGGHVTTAGTLNALWSVGMVGLNVVLEVVMPGMVKAMMGPLSTIGSMLAPLIHVF